VEEGAELAGPFYVGPGCHVRAGARIGPDAVLTRDVAVETGARVADSVLWDGTRVAEGASVEGALVGTSVRIGRNASARPGAVLGEGTQLTDFSRTA
jgi:NDP-sugar pyrophosphorylase family protein